LTISNRLFQGKLKDHSSIALILSRDPDLAGERGVFRYLHTVRLLAAG
jgi:hypothetical protein